MGTRARETPTVPKAVKDDLSAKALSIIESDLKPSYVEPPPDDPQLNYIVDISTKWRGCFFYFISTYACPEPDSVSRFFDHSFARLEYQHNGRFGLAYMRHTEKWWPLYEDLTMDEALKTICDESLFHP